MITYSKTSWGLHLLLRVYGSAFPRSLIFSIISAAITVALYLTKQEQILADWRHPYPYHIFAFIVGFIVVFRQAQLQSLGNMTCEGNSEPARPDNLRATCSSHVQESTELWQVLGGQVATADHDCALGRLLHRGNNSLLSHYACIMSHAALHVAQTSTHTGPCSQFTLVA